jgi:hypothetical protein
VWQQVAGKTILRRHYSGHSSFWLALDASSLQLISFGSLDLDPNPLGDLTFVGAGAGTVSIIATATDELTSLQAKDRAEGSSSTLPDLHTAEAAHHRGRVSSSQVTAD